MRNSYDGMSDSPSSAIATNAFKGSSTGWGADAMKTLLGLYRGYTDLIPAHYRFKWFGDKSALAEDQSSLRPMLRKNNKGEWVYIWEDDVEDENANDNADVGGEVDRYDMNEATETGRLNDEIEASRFKYRTPNTKSRNAWEASRMASAASSGEYNPSGVSNVSVNADGDSVDNPWNANLTKPMTSYDTAKTGSWVDKDSATKWQKFLNTQGYNLKVDGDWQNATQTAYDDWLSKNPNYMNDDDI